MHPVEHCTFHEGANASPDWDVVDQMVDARIFVSLTGAILPGFNPPSVLKARRYKIRVNVERMHPMGARIVCPSNAIALARTPLGVLPHGVIDVTSVGFTSAEALASVTSVAAAGFGFGPAHVLRDAPEGAPLQACKVAPHPRQPWSHS